MAVSAVVGRFSGGHRGGSDVFQPDSFHKKQPTVRANSSSFDAPQPCFIDQLPYHQQTDKVPCV